MQNVIEIVNCSINNTGPSVICMKKWYRTLITNQTQINSRFSKNPISKLPEDRIEGNRNDLREG